MGSLILVIILIMIIARYTIFIDQSIHTQKKFLIFVGSILVIVFSIRNADLNNGSDLDNYYQLYRRAILSSSVVDFLNNNPFEKGYLLLNWLLSRIVKLPQFILVFQAIFCIGSVLRFIYKYSNDFLISVLGFMSFGVMQFFLTGFRQSIAISICLLALEMAEKKKILPFLILVALATSIHQTAVIFFIVYIFIRIPITKITVILQIIGVILLSQIVPKIINLGNDVFEKNYVSQFGGNSTGGLINVMISVAVLGLMYYSFNTGMYYAEGLKEEKEIGLTNEKINFRLMPILILGTGFYCMRYQALVLERISLYFTPVLFILLPQVIDRMFDERSKKLLKMCVIAGMTFLAFWRLRNMQYITMWR